MPTINISVWRTTTWLGLAVILTACMPVRTMEEDFTNLSPPVNTVPIQPANPTVPPRKHDLNPSQTPPASLIEDGEPADPETISLINSKEAVQAALSRLSDMLNLPVDQIEIVSAKRVQWKTECLGISSPGSVCPQVITPGWVIVLQAEDKEYIFHTDETGSRVRQK